MTQLSPALFFSLLELAGCGNLNPPCSMQALEGTSHFSPRWLVWFRPSCLRPQRQQGLKVRLPKVCEHCPVPADPGVKTPSLRMASQQKSETEPQVRLPAGSLSPP